MALSTAPPWVAPTSSAPTPRPEPRPIPGPRRDPLFDVIRIAAALMVVFSHAFTTTGTHEPEPIHFGPNLGVTWGHLGVAIFFTTSGYLVAQSWRRQPEGFRFLLKRALRIWPAFLATLVLSVLVLGPIATDSGLGSYLTSGATWRYLTHNAVMSPITFTLPGVFRHQPLSGVDGSFWTLPYEIGAYLGLLALGLFRLVRWWLLSALLIVFLVFYDTSVAGRALPLSQHWNGLWLNNAIRLGVWFVAGVLLAQLSHLVVRRHWVALGALAVAAVGIVEHEAVLGIPALALLVIYLGTLPCRPAERLHRLGDPSYGMYLSGFAIQQFLVWVGLVHVHQPWLSFIEGAVLTVVFGYASWHLLEKRAMRLVKPRPGVRPGPAATTDPEGWSALVGGVEGPRAVDRVEAVEQVAHPLPLGP
jgi:peptidoglycan/LPS O-acetylase OafA/YrhL